MRIEIRPEMDNAWFFALSSWIVNRQVSQGLNNWRSVRFVFFLKTCSVDGLVLVRPCV